MYGKMKDYLAQTLAEIKDAGLYKEERLIESPQQAAIQVKGQEVLNFCANNYLGLSNNPRLIKAAQEMMDRRGPITSRRRIPSFTPLVSMPTAVCSSLSSRTRMPSSPTP